MCPLLFVACELIRLMLLFDWCLQTGPLLVFHLAKMKFRSKKGWKTLVPLHLKGKSALRFSLFPKVNSNSFGPGEAPVYLNVYDLTPMNGYMYWTGLGIYHSGVEGITIVLFLNLIYLTASSISTVILHLHARTSWSCWRKCHFPYMLWEGRGILFHPCMSLYVSKCLGRCNNVWNHLMVCDKWMNVELAWCSWLVMMPEGIWWFAKIIIFWVISGIT